MSPLINVGLIGCGRIARLVHLNTLKNLSGVRLKAVADSDPECRENARRTVPEVDLFSDYKELLKDSDISAVIICLPNYLHVESAVAAFEHGKHVYLEKPIAVSNDEADEVIRVWRERNLVGMMGFNLRFNPIYGALKDHIKSGVIGDVTTVRTVFSSSGRALPEWKKHRKTGGGALFDLASHHVDLIRHIFETDIIEISARFRSHKTEDDNVLLEYRTSANIDTQSYFSINSADEDKIEVYGTRGKLAADRYRSLNIEVETSDPPHPGRFRHLKRGIHSLLRSPNLPDKIIAPGREPSFIIALGHFVSAIRENHKASPDLFDGFKCLSVLEAAEESARTGRIISL